MMTDRNQFNLSEESNQTIQNTNENTNLIRFENFQSTPPEYSNIIDQQTELAIKASEKYTKHASLIEEEISKIHPTESWEDSEGSDQDLQINETEELEVEYGPPYSIDQEGEDSESDYNNMSEADDEKTIENFKQTKKDLQETNWSQMRGWEYLKIPESDASSLSTLSNLSEQENQEDQEDLEIDIVSSMLALGLLDKLAEDDHSTKVFITEVEKLTGNEEELEMKIYKGEEHIEKMEH